MGHFHAKVHGAGALETTSHFALARGKANTAATLLGRLPARRLPPIPNHNTTSVNSMETTYPRTADAKCIVPSHEGEHATSVQTSGLAAFEPVHKNHRDGSMVRSSVPNVLVSKSSFDSALSRLSIGTEPV